MSFPTLMEARVVAVDVPNHRVICDIPSAQMLGIGAKLLVHGPADGIRVNHKAMPGRGTWGLVAFPYGNSVNGVWLGAVFPSQLDALTTNTDQFMEYNSHGSGAYEVLDGEGQWTKSFPDGTFIQVADSTTKVSTFRHTVDTGQAQQLTPFPDSERVPSPPSPRYLYVKHASGTSTEVDPTGNTTVSGATGATFTATFGGATFVIDSSGNIKGTAANGAEVHLQANGGTFDINTSGGISANVPSGQHIDLSAAGGGVSYTLVRTDLLVSIFNAHKHTNGNAGANTGTPVTSISNGDIQSVLANVSE